MPRKKAPVTKTPPRTSRGAERPLGVLIEDLYSRLQVVVEGVGSAVERLDAKLDAFRQEVDTRFVILESVVRQNSADIRQNSADVRQNGADIRALTDRVEKLEHIEERVTALERRG